MVQTVRTYVFVYRSEGFVPAGLLDLTVDGRASFATFAYGERYLRRPDRIAVDPVALPLPEAAGNVTFRTEEDFAVFNGIRDAAPDGWGQYLMYKAMGDRLPNEADLLLASGDHRVAPWPLVRPPSAPSGSPRGARAPRRASTSRSPNWPRRPNGPSMSTSSTRTCAAC
ncbi:hypothetical protein [Caulobacter segnis]